MLQACSTMLPPRQLALARSHWRNRTWLPPPHSLLHLDQAVKSPDPVLDSPPMVVHLPEA